MPDNKFTKELPQVLVVDDDPVLRLILCKFLESKGFTVLEAEDGKQALEIFSQYRPDIVLMDGYMPEMDGFSATEAFRQQEDSAHTPILMVTAFDDEASVKRAFNVGASEFITKPINWVVLHHRLINLWKSLQMEEERERIQTQLQQSQKMESIGQLTGGIAHDFNNMLASILGFTELAREELAQHDNDKIQGYLSEVYKSGSRARDLVAQMLAFSRGGEGELEPLVLSPLIKESLKMLGSTLPSSIEMDLQLDDEDLTVMTNPVHLHQLIMNLCINARDAMKGKGHITIGLARVNDVVTKCRSCHERVAGDYIQLFVRDTGPGIKLEQLDRIFDPFYSTKEVGKGSGMGLSMLHGIMHDHGGHIVVETASGKDTTFTLLFPVMDVQVDTVNVENVDANTPSGQTLDGNILVVDDEPSVGHFIGELLKSRGCHVTVETDSQSALSRFKQNPDAFDLVVTDQTMPGLTGEELSQALLEIRPDLPIILCTGYSEQIDAAGAEAIGIRGYVSKPIETKRFLGLIEELLQIGKTGTKSAATL